MADQIGDALYILTLHSKSGKQDLGIGWPLLFLKRAYAGAVFLLRRAYSYVMHQSGALSEKLSVDIQRFHPAYELCQAMDLDQMLDAHGIAPVEIYHLFFKQVNKTEAVHTSSYIMDLAVCCMQAAFFHCISLYKFRQ